MNRPVVGSIVALDNNPPDRQLRGGRDRIGTIVRTYGPGEGDAHIEMSLRPAAIDPMRLAKLLHYAAGSMVLWTALPKSDREKFMKKAQRALAREKECG